jgi:hypothetical protein
VGDDVGQQVPGGPGGVLVVLGASVRVEDSTEGGRFLDESVAYVIDGSSTSLGAQVIVLHGWWSSAEGGLVLWAEGSSLPAEPPRRPGRRPRIQDHPFAVPADEIAAALGLEGARRRSAVLMLPTLGHGPETAPELEGVWPGTDADAEPSIDEFEAVLSDGAPDDHQASAPTQWRVPTLILAADAALAALRRSRAKESDASEVSPSLGADLRCLIVLERFATDLVCRCRVLPWVVPAENSRATAQWRPLVTGLDAAWLRALVDALPGSFGAQIIGGARVSAAAEVACAVDALVDAAVRDAAGKTPLRRSTGSQGFATAWRTALRGPDGVFAASVGEVARLQSALVQWQADAVGSGPVRACFRLVEPADAPDREVGNPGPANTAVTAIVPPDAQWRLDFALQSSDEPSLVVDADKVWRTRGPLRGLGSALAGPQETLLSELGRAVRLYPELEASLRTSRPASSALDTAGAHAFLSEAAPLLLASGFGVLVPGWWSRPAAQLGARLRASTPSQPGATEGAPGIGKEGLVDFDWQLAVGEHTLTDAEVADLVDAQQPLVRLRGQWMQVDPDRLARARVFLERQSRQPRQQMPLARVMDLLGAPDDGPGGLPVLGVDAEGWLGDLLAADGRHLEPLTAPPGFAGTLRPYQERGLSWLSFLETVGMGGVLADDMGLGKTIQLLALMARDAHGGPGVGPTLLVCPMSLVGNWQREAKRFTPDLRVHVHHGAERSRGKQFEAAVASCDLVITTYALLARDASALRAMTWHRLVLDEAQAVKNAATKVAIAARSMPATRRFVVTGTPVENRLADLWSLMEIVNPSLLGPPRQFKERFATPIERHGDDSAGARLRALTQPFMLRRVKTDTSIISDLPAKFEMEVVCSLTREQASLYQAVVADMMDKIATTTGIERRGLVLATMTRLKQVCNHPAQFLHDGSRLQGRSGKLARLDETLEEVLASGEKALLFTQYAEFGGMLRSHLSARFGREVAFLHGGVSMRERDAMVARFQDLGRGGPPLFVLSLKAGGTGLTLTAANHVIHVDRWWNPAVEDQATDRAFRIGQTRNVQVRKLVCAGTLEEKIGAMIRDKKHLADAVVGSGEGWLTELSTARLRELFTLDAGSVVE